MLLLGAAVMTGDALSLVIGSLTSTWIVFEWLLFSATLLAIRHKKLEIKRALPELGRDAVTWSGVSVCYEGRWESSSLALLGSMTIQEFIPGGLRSSATRWYGLLRPFSVIRWTGSIETIEAGLYLLPGLSIELFSPSGLFHAFVFQDSPLKINVYPNVFGLNVARPSKKSLNRLLQLGLHRYTRKGGQGELLEIRDYVPGDQLKQIAWRISARRDKLFVKELEREVPIRTWLFVDGGLTARLGQRGQRPLDQMIQVVGQVTRGTLESKDPVGLCLFHSTAAQWLLPATGRRHLFRVLRRLAQFSTAMPSHYFGQVSELSKNVEAYLYRRYPELMHPSLNPEPKFILPPFSRAEQRRRKIERHMVAVLYLILNDGLESAAGAIALADDAPAWSKILTDFAVRENLHLTMEPSWTGDHIERESGERLNKLAQCLRMAVMRASDNELFVCFLDFVGASTKALTAAIRSARARHHKVLVVLTNHKDSPKLDQGFPDVLGSPIRANSAELSKFFERLYDYQLYSQRREWLEELRKMAIPVINLDCQQNAAVIASQVSRLKWQGAMR
jgi:uncharacterized protein (DUF58 family)